MEAFQERVIVERQELDDKISCLELFTTSVAFSTLSQAAQERLTRQLRLMREYSAVLAERIAAF